MSKCSYIHISPKVNPTEFCPIKLTIKNSNEALLNIPSFKGEFPKIMI